MSTAEKWRNLHDATLESLEFCWASGEARIRVRTGDGTSSRYIVMASPVRFISCGRQMPWGRSVSINAVRGPTSTGDACVLEIEMQSGDLIRIEAGAFRLLEDE